VRRLLFISTVLALASPMTQGWAADGGCIADWSEAAQIVQTEKLKTVEELTAAARTSLKGEILKTTLCKDDGDYVYRLVVRGPDGKLKTVIVNARAPFKDAKP
jgi:uncharacterized membrane protein YkoI